MVELIEELYPKELAALLPAGPLDRARCRQIVQIVNANIQPKQTLAT